MVGEKRVEDLMNERPFNSLEDVERIEGFDKGMVDDLRSGGANGSI